MGAIPVRGGADHRGPWFAKRRRQLRPATQATENDRLRHG